MLAFIITIIYHYWLGLWMLLAGAVDVQSTAQRELHPVQAVKEGRV